MALLALALLPGFCRAALLWDTKRIELTANPGDEKAVGVFKFKNSGTSTINIVTVHSGCGCTTAELEQRTYAPGDSGEIKATFSLGDYVGVQEKTIQVTTDDDPSHSVPLVLQVTIPELLAYTPRLLFWRVNDAPEEKSVAIAASGPLKIAAIETGATVPADATVRVEPVEAGAKYRLLIRPASTAKPVTVAIACVAKFTDGTTRPFTIYALVK